MSTSKTPKELAELTATAALDSLRAALESERELREKLRRAKGDHYAWSQPVVQLERVVREAEQRTDAAFAAWRKAQEAVPPEGSTP